MADVREIIKQIVGDQSTPVIVCTVNSVDKNTRTVDCSPINEDAPLLGVNLQANQQCNYGLCIFPEVGSYVVVAPGRDTTSGVVIITEKIEAVEIVIGDTSAVMDADGVRINVGDISAHIDKSTVTFNGGNLGGLVKIQELTDKINEFINTFNAHTHTGTHGPTSAPLSPATAFNRTDYENKKVKQ